MADGKLDSASFTTGLTTGFIGRNTLYFSSVTSTNDIARQQAIQKAPEGTAVIADQQTTGRGRLKRAWVSPKGNIAVTIVLYPDKRNLQYLTMLASLSVKYSIEKTTGLSCQLKWPNDVLIQEKKVSGILIESQVESDTVHYAVIGIGINVNMKLMEYPEIASFATSLHDELGYEVSRIELIRNLFVEMEKIYLRLQAGNSILTEWRNNLVTLGKNVRVRTNEDVFEGIAEGIARDGSLLLRCPDGTLIKFMAGDVTLK